MKCITLNLWTGGYLFDQAIEFIKSENPDVLLLQEVYSGGSDEKDRRFRSVSELRQALPDYVHHFAAAYFDDQPHVQAEQGNAVFSKFPINEGRAIFFDVPYGTFRDLGPGPDYSHYPSLVQEVLIQLPDQRVMAVYNIHGIWGLDGGDTPRRLQMAKTLKEAFKDKENVILAGDFNLRPNTQTIAILEQSLTSVFKNELTSTFNMKRKDNPGYATAVVDMMFVSPKIIVGTHHCPQIDISDHLPLVAELEV